MDITLFVISTDNFRKTRIGFADHTFSAAGYEVASRDVHEGGSTARWRSVGASAGGKIVDVVSLLGDSWEQTAANVRAALA